MAISRPSGPVRSPTRTAPSSPASRTGTGGRAGRRPCARTRRRTVGPLDQSPAGDDSPTDAGAQGDHRTSSARPGLRPGVLGPAGGGGVVADPDRPAGKGWRRASDNFTGQTRQVRGEAHGPALSTRPGTPMPTAPVALPRPGAGPMPPPPRPRPGRPWGWPGSGRRSPAPSDQGGPPAAWSRPRRLRRPAGRAVKPALNDRSGPAGGACPPASGPGPPPSSARTRGPRGAAAPGSG